MASSRQGNPIPTYIMATWRHWAVSLALVVIMILLSPIVSREAFPLIPLAFAALLALFIYGKRKRSNQGLAIPYIVTVSMLLEAVLLFGLNLTERIIDIYELTGKPANAELPVIVQLSISPVLAAVSGIFILRRLGSGRFFRGQHGRSDVSIVQRMVWQETRYQTRLLFMLSLGMSVAAWLYTYYSFVTISINKPDKFFFQWLPLIVYILSLVYLGFRCVSLWAFYSQNDPVMMLNPHRSSIMRCLIVCHDHLYLINRRLDVKHEVNTFYETPVRLRMPFTKSFSTDEALKLFRQYTGLDKGIKAFRFIFDTFAPDTDNSLFHYLCIVDEEKDLDPSRINGGKWYSIDQLKRMDREHTLSAELSAELVHIYTVGATSKRYDIDGNRRYAIKDYVPGFSLSEIGERNIDFTDPRWLRVARLNADKPFFHLRRFLSRITQPSVQ